MIASNGGKVAEIIKQNGDDDIDVRLEELLPPVSIIMLMLPIQHWVSNNKHASR